MLYIFIFLHQTTTIDSLKCDANRLYIFIFLHQTTTCSVFIRSPTCCISLYSYIKPQLFLSIWKINLSCISLYSYIKPQLSLFFIFLFCVVYLYIPTSNHNSLWRRYYCTALYIFIFLHQTTTFLFLYLFFDCCISLYSYIKPQLLWMYPYIGCGCISLYSYIKPQLYYLGLNH